MKNSFNAKDSLIIDETKKGQLRHLRIGHYFGAIPMWERSKPYNLRNARTRFLS